MDKEQALKIITDVCAAFTGNLQAHQSVQAALAVIKEKLKDE